MKMIILLKYAGIEWDANFANLKLPSKLYINSQIKKVGLHQKITNFADISLLVFKVERI